MPGLTLMMTSGARRPVEREFREAQTLLLHRSDYQAHSIVSADTFNLGWVGYEGYPVRILPSGPHVIYFEGRIYNCSSSVVEDDLMSIASKAFQGDDGPAVERFMLAHEGSYVAAVVSGDFRNLLVFTDPFSRLPLYYYVDSSRLIVSREAKFIHAIQGGPAFDRVGCAQVLAFGLPLGDRTVLEKVRAFPEAALLQARSAPDRLDSRVQNLHTWNLDEEDHSKSAAVQARDFANLFSAACQNWASHPDSGGNLVSLSGGHDSRAVAAGIAKFDSKAVAVTYRDPSGKRENEVRYAKTVANCLGIAWECIDLSTATESDYERLAWLKDGMNYSYVGFMLRYLEEIRSRWGSENRTYFSGDGGDDCLKVTSPRVSLSNVEMLVDYVIQNETCMPPDRAEAVMDAPAGILREELRSLFESYPEQDLARRVKHFKIFERGRRFYFEGEDRARFFIWQDSPFYSLPLFQHCMRVPDAYKHYNVFCRNALMALSPKAAAVPTTGSGFAPASYKYVAYYRFKECALNLPPVIKTLGYWLLGRHSAGPFVTPASSTAYLRNELAQHTPLVTLFRESALLPALKQFKDDHSFYCFWTIVMLEKAYRSRMA